MPKYQGELDGLCGIYSIINALEECGEVFHEDIFKLACSALGKNRWPKVLWEGTTLKDMQNMLKHCLEKHPNLKVNYPFTKNPPLSNDEYWKRFDEIFADEATICAIIGVTQPSAHWIVATKEGGRIWLSDSKAGEPYKRKNRSSFHAGLRRKKQSQWLLDRKELIILSAPAN